MRSSSFIKNFGVFAWRALIILTFLLPNFNFTASNPAIAASEPGLQSEMIPAAPFNTLARPEIIRQTPRTGVRPQSNPVSQSKLVKPWRDSDAFAPDGSSPLQSASMMLTESFQQSINVAVIASLHSSRGGYFPTT